MKNKDLLEGIRYEGYYDDMGNFYIDINKENAKKLIEKITGADQVIIR